MSTLISLEHAIAGRPSQRLGRKPEPPIERYCGNCHKIEAFSSESFNLCTAFNRKDRLGDDACGSLEPRGRYGEVEDSFKEPTTTIRSYQRTQTGDRVTGAQGGTCNPAYLSHKEPLRQPQRAEAAVEGIVQQTDRSIEEMTRRSRATEFAESRELTGRLGRYAKVVENVEDLERLDRLEKGLNRKYQKLVRKNREFPDPLTSWITKMRTRIQGRRIVLLQEKWLIPMGEAMIVSAIRTSQYVTKCRVTGLSLNQTRALAYQVKFCSKQLSEIGRLRNHISEASCSELVASIETLSSRLREVKRRIGLMETRILCQYCGTPLKGSEKSAGNGKRPFTQTTELYCPRCGAAYDTRARETTSAFSSHPRHLYQIEDQQNHYRNCSHC